MLSKKNLVTVYSEILWCYYPLDKCDRVRIALINIETTDQRPYSWAAIPKKKLSTNLHLLFACIVQRTWQVSINVWNNFRTTCTVIIISKLHPQHKKLNKVISSCT